jgi:hypothetical protein
MARASALNGGHIPCPKPRGFAVSKRIVIGCSADRSLMVADLTLDGADVTVGHVVAEAQTPPFLTDTRVVVVRGAERLDADGVAALQAYLGAPLPTTDLVLIYAGKPTKKLLDAVKGGGGVVAAPDVGSNRRDRSSFVDEQVAASGLRLTTAATAALVDQLGEDVNRLSGILDTLVATFGTGSRLDVDDLTPYLGEALLDDPAAGRREGVGDEEDPQRSAGPTEAATRRGPGRRSSCCTRSRVMRRRSPR